MNMVCPKCGSGRVWHYHLPPGHIWCDACNQRSTIDEGEAEMKNDYTKKICTRCGERLGVHTVGSMKCPEGYCTFTDAPRYTAADLESARAEGRREAIDEILSMAWRNGEYYQISISDFDDIVRNITNTPDKDKPCPT